MTTIAAHELGRMMLAGGQSLLDLLSLHNKLIGPLLEGPEAGPDAERHASFCSVRQGLPTVAPSDFRRTSRSCRDKRNCADAIS